MRERTGIALLTVPGFLEENAQRHFVLSGVAGWLLMMMLLGRLLLVVLLWL